MRVVLFIEDTIFFDGVDVGIGKKHKLDVFCLSEIPLFCAGFGIDRDDLCARSFKIVVSLAQTEELPGADPSVQGPEENQHGFLFANQALERGFVSVAV